VFAHALTAASAAGFGKGLESRFAYRAASRIKNNTVKDVLSLSFGQVDAEVGYYFRKFVQDKSDSQEATFEQVFSTYVDMAETFCEDIPLVIKGINPTTLVFEDTLKRHIFLNIAKRITNQEEREVVERKVQESDISVKSHAAQNVLANVILEDMVKSRGIQWFDVRKQIETEPDSGMAKMEFLNLKEDVHLIDSLYVQKLHYDALMNVVLD